MIYRKILFIRMWPATAWVGSVAPPVGIGYLMELLKQYGFEFKLIDMALGEGLPDIINTINYFRPDIIGASMLTYRYLSSYKILEQIKKKYPKIPIVSGGAHISTFREKALYDCLAIDVGFIRDAEHTFLEFCKGEQLENIKMIIYRDKKGKVQFTREEEQHGDLDSLPWPKYEALNLKRYISKEILLLTSRGCPYSCIFCPVSLAIGRKLRARGAENVCDEIEYWYEKGYRRFAILDDNFTFYKERTIAICKEIKRRKFRNIKLRCGNGIRADRIDEEVLVCMKEAGFIQISFGVESVSDKILKVLKKGETVEQIEKAIKNAIKLGFDIVLFFLVGSPGETKEDVDKYINFCLRYPIFDVRFYNLIPYPGTELYDWVEEKKYFVQSPDIYLNNQSAFTEYPVFQTPEFTLEERRKALKKSKLITKMVRKKWLKNKFKNKGVIWQILYYFIIDIYINERFQNLIRQNRVFRYLGEKLYFNL